MLAVRDIAEMDGLGLTVVAGADGLANEVGWLHVSELEDPTPFLEGEEFLLATGLGIGDLATTQRAYLRRLARHGLAGLGFGVGFGFSDVPPRWWKKRTRWAFRSCPCHCEVPFVAITKAAGTRLASAQLERQTRARAGRPACRRRAAGARCTGPARDRQQPSRLLARAPRRARGRVVAERRTGKRVAFDDGLELQLGGGAVLRAARDGEPFGEYDRLVLHHGRRRSGSSSAATGGQRGGATSPAICWKTSRTNGSTAVTSRGG